MRISVLFSTVYFLLIKSVPFGRSGSNNKTTKVLSKFANCCFIKCNFRFKIWSSQNNFQFITLSDV